MGNIQLGLNAPTTARAVELVETLREQVARESEFAREQVKRIWSLPLVERQRQGKAIGQAKILSRTGKWVHIQLPDHESLFREGDFLFWTEDGNPSSPKRSELVLEDESGSTFICRIRSGHSLLAPGAEGVLDFGFSDLSDFYNQALDSAMDSVKGRDQILPLLTGDLSSKCDMVLDAQAREVAEQNGLNDAQAEGLALAWSTDLAALIQGPPGTGKTAVLSLLAVMAANKGLRVLITGLTHRGIDNALSAIRRRDRDVMLARVGAPTSGKDGIANWDSFADCPWSDSDRGFIVGATPFCLLTGRLKGVEFDYTLFDEASQVHLPLAIMGMMGAKRWVFFGDHMQLPPVLPTITSQERIESSIFGKLADRDFGQMLDITYRLCDKLCEWPSETFYHKALRSHPSVGRKRLPIQMLPGIAGQVLDPQFPLVHLEVNDPQATTSSELEARQVVAVLRAALQAGMNAKEIAVVTPFRKQNRIIRNLLRERCGTQSDAIVVDTVERMQGQERDLVVVSLTSGNDAFVERVVEFYFQPQRLNVAATRARYKLVLVGRSDWEDLFERRPDLAEHGICLRGLLSKAKKISTHAGVSKWQG